jgi:hypothetical protein
MKPTIEILSTLTDDQYTTFRMMRTRCYCWNPDAEKITFESDIGEQTMTFDTWEDARRFAESPDKNQYIRKSDVVSMLNERLGSIKMGMDYARDRMDHEVFSLYHRQYTEVKSILSDLDDLEQHEF